MSAEKVPHIWSKDSLLSKSQRYASIMLSHDRENWQFGFWSALTFEILAKAALANVSPVLLAEPRDWNNVYFALGDRPSSAKFIPKSIDISQVLRRLEAILPEFTRELLNFSITHMDRRNSELHSGDLPFDGLGTSVWLPMYYQCCEVLLASLNETLDLLFGEDEAKSAETLMEALKDEAAKAVQKIINAHKTVWENKSPDEKEKLSKQAETLSTRHSGHRVNCPSCGSVALLYGSAVGAPVSSIEDDLIVERQSMLPSHFECTACGLKISGFSKLNACGLGDNFTSRYSYDAADFFGIEPEIIDPYEGYEPDFNEY
jgi:hypothetical protein